MVSDIIGFRTCCPPATQSYRDGPTGDCFCCSPGNVCQYPYPGTGYSHQICCPNGGCCDDSGCHPDGDRNDQHCGSRNQACQDCTNNGKVSDFGCVKEQCCKVCGSDRSTCCGQGCCERNQCMAGDQDQHCGQSGAVCQDCTKMGPGYHCVKGMCQATCNCPGPRPSNAFSCCCCPGQMNGLWVNLQNDLDPNGHPTGPGFCGSCSTSCASEAVCMNGTCRCPKGSMQICPDKPCNASFSFKYCDDSGACMGG